MVGVWEGLNLGSNPNDHMPSQKDPKISIEMRCSAILPPGSHRLSSCEKVTYEKSFWLDLHS